MTGVGDDVPAEVSTRRWRIVSGCVLAAIAVAWFFTAPRDGEFWWSDAPRHALNSIFLADVARDLPLSAPRAYAVNYYVQYPALTILFYPPLFYVAAAPFVLALGASHWVIVVVLSLSALLLAWALRRGVEEWAGPAAGLTAGVLMLALPASVYWGRQVMLEIPALAFVALAYWAAVRTERGSQLAFWGLVLASAAAMYTKMSMVAVLPGMLLPVWRAWRAKTLPLRTVAAGALVGALLMVPLAWLTVSFGQGNVQSVVGVPDGAASRNTLAGWLWYARELPGIAGWGWLIAGLVGWGWLWRTRRTAAIHLAVWFACAYVFFSVVDLKEARHGMPLIMPIAIAAAVALCDLLSVARMAWLGPVVAITAAVWGLATPVPRVDGYREAAEYVAQRAPENTAILFAGIRDGAFVFNMRAATQRHDLWTVRADKILLRLAIRRELGVEEKLISEDEIRDRLRRLGVSYVVSQEEFWQDLESMRRLEHVLTNGEQFQEVARIPLPANVGVDDKMLRIYRATEPVTRDPAAYEIELPIIGTTLQRQEP